MRSLVGALLLAPSVLTSGTAGEEDSIVVNRLGGSDFEVVAGSFTATSEYFWCGAASFIERRSGLSPSTPIYVKRPLAPSRSAPGRKSVVFSTSGVGLAGAGGSLTLDVDRAGAMLQSARARQYCRDAFTRSTK